MTVHSHCSNYSTKLFHSLNEFGLILIFKMVKYYVEKSENWMGQQACFNLHKFPIWYIYLSLAMTVDCIFLHELNTGWEQLI